MEVFERSYQVGSMQFEFLEPAFLNSELVSH